MNAPTAHPVSALRPEPPPLHLPLTEFGLPEMIEIEPIHTCNLRCTMCHVSYEKLTHAKLDVDRLLEQLGGVENRWVAVGSTHEPSAHPQFSRLIRGLGERGMKIKLTTNGTLFTQRILHEIARTELDQVVVSFDGIRPETYERIRRHAQFDRAIARITRLRRTFEDRPTHFHVNYTVLRSNLDEMLEAVNFWDGLRFDHVGFIQMVVRDRNELLLQESLRHDRALVRRKLEEVARAVIEGGLRIGVGSAYFQEGLPIKQEYPAHFRGSMVRSHHPEARPFSEPRTFIQDGPFPGMPVDCRSAFKYVRILYNGDVHLCHQFRIGNIYERSLRELWYGEEAQRIRRQLQESPRLCHACDYYRFCIRAARIDYEQEESFFAGHILAGEPARDIPRLLESGYRGFNLVQFGPRIYALAQSIGPIDLATASAEIMQQHQDGGRCFIGEDLAGVKRRIPRNTISLDVTPLTPAGPELGRENAA